MSNLWTWGGKFFGYREGDDLRTHTGIHVGKFHGDEIYGSDGYYLGEVKNDRRLITKINKKGHRKSSFNPRMKRTGRTKHTDYTGYTMYTGSKDFPAPEEFNNK